MGRAGDAGTQAQARPLATLAPGEGKNGRVDSTAAHTPLGRYQLPIRGQVRGRTPADLAKQIAEQMTYKLSSDDRFGLNVGPQPCLWVFQIFLSPVS